jgi:hypothetical protein
MALINVPAPAGSALAGQIQMRALEGLGRALGLWYQSNLQSKDIRNIQVAQQAAEAMGLGQIPSWGMPQMRSRLMKDLQAKASIKDIFADPLERQYLQSRIEATEALTGQRIKQAETPYGKPPWWVEGATPQQIEDYRGRVGGPLVQVGERLLSPEKRQELAEAGIGGHYHSLIKFCPFPW